MHPYYPIPKTPRNKYKKKGTQNVEESLTHAAISFVLLHSPASQIVKLGRISNINICQTH